MERILKTINDRKKKKNVQHSLGYFLIGTIYLILHSRVFKIKNVNFIE